MVFVNTVVVVPRFRFVYVTSHTHYLTHTLTEYSNFPLIKLFLFYSPLGGATVKGPQIAPQRNGIRISTTRRDGRVFAKLRNFPHKSTRNEGARLLCRALHAGRKALIG